MNDDHFPDMIEFRTPPGSANFLGGNGVTVRFDGSNLAQTGNLLESLLFVAEFVAGRMAAMDPSLEVQHLTIKTLSNSIFRYGRQKGYR
jgi:hypothetical protein